MVRSAIVRDMVVVAVVGVTVGDPNESSSHGGVVVVVVFVVAGANVAVVVRPSIVLQTPWPQHTAPVASSGQFSSARNEISAPSLSPIIFVTVLLLNDRMARTAR